MRNRGLGTLRFQFPLYKGGTSKSSIGKELRPSVRRRYALSRGFVGSDHGRGTIAGATRSGLRVLEQLLAER